MSAIGAKQAPPSSPDLLDVWKIAARAAADRSDRAAKDSPKGQPWRSPLIDSIRLGFARDIVVGPGRCSKCADARRWNADTAVKILGGEEGARIGVLREVLPRGYMARAGQSHSGSCERGCGDQRSRQKFKLGHLVSPLHMKSRQRVAPLWKWGSDRRTKVTFPHAVSKLRGVGRVVR